MNRIRRLTFVAISMLLISCQSDQIEHDPTSIPTPLADLSATLAAADNIDYSGDRPYFLPFGLLNVNDQYLIKHRWTENDFLGVIKLPEMTYLYTWGTKGSGPGEFSWPPMFLFTANDEDILLMSDIIDFKQEQFKVGISSLTLLQSDDFRQDGQTQPFEIVTPIDKQKYVVGNIPFDNDDNAEFLFLETNNEIPISAFGNYPNTTTEFQNKPHRFKKTGASNSKLKRFVAFYKYHDAFKVIDFNGDLIGHHKVNGFEYEYADTVVVDPYLSRNVTHSTDDLIYTIGYGMRMSELESGYRPTTFEVWNWEGESVYRALFDRQIYSYAISEVHGKIYGFTLDDPENIYIYDLPTIQK